jgi:NAD-dependent deacetylase
LFGESLPPNALTSAYEHAQNCRMMLVVGTSAVVYPAAHLPAVAKENGAVIVEINLERAFAAADFVILEKAGTALPRLLETVKNLMSTRH